MGLLDDAIREHLDLKRARGADPAEIERMEREALGPVRREPTIGSSRFEEHAASPLERGYEEDHLTDLEDLQEMGYHDSTAPHVHHEHLEYEHHPLFAEEPEPEQPRRRFLRRNRPASPPAAGVAGAGFHEEPPLGRDDMFEHDEHLADHERFDRHERYDEFEQPAPVEREQPVDHETPEPAAPQAPPPHLQFDQPPKRPRFTAEPPALRPEDDEQAAAAGQPPHDEAPTPAPATPPPPREPESPPEAQETTEFDVQRHIAETRHQPDEEPAPAQARPAEGRPAQARPADAEPAGAEPAGAEPNAPEHPEEDVLEETPEFLQDTPEHDRLWFEQRPPRDFDFDG